MNKWWKFFKQMRWNWWTDDENFWTDEWLTKINIWTDEVERVKKIFEQMRSNRLRNFWTASCDVLSISCFHEVEQIHGVGEVYMAISSKTANRKEHFCVRGHICQRFFKRLHRYKMQFIIKLANPFPWETKTTLSQKSATCVAACCKTSWMKGNVVHFSTHLSWSNLSCAKSSFYRLQKIVAKSSFLSFFYRKPNSLKSCSQQIEAICYSDLHVFKEGCFALSFSPCKLPLLDHNRKFLDHSC